MRVVFVALVLVVIPCEARPSALEPHDVGPVTISMPRGWAFTGGASKGVAIARQDPSRKDAATLLVVVSTANASDDQLLDAIAGQSAQGLQVIKRGAGPGGTGKLLVADGTTDGIQIRLGAVAIAAGGTAVVGLLIATPADFDGLGGTDLVASVMASMKAAGATAPATGHEPFMTAEYTQYGSLIVPPMTRRLDVSELAGEWSTSGGGVWVNSRGSLAGSVSTSSGWTIDDKGNFGEVFRGATTNYGNVRGVSDKSSGTVRIDDNGQLVIQTEKRTEYYAFRGWYDGADKSVMRLNGPYYTPIAPSDINNVNFNIYMNHDYTRKAQ
jgi:hypothetical protein